MKSPRIESVGFLLSRLQIVRLVGRSARSHSPLGVPTLPANQKKIDDLPDQNQPEGKKPDKAGDPPPGIKAMNAAKAQEAQTPKQIRQAWIGMLVAIAHEACSQLDRHHWVSRRILVKLPAPPMAEISFILGCIFDGLAARFKVFTHAFDRITADQG